MRHFIIQFEQGEYIDGIECYFYEPILKKYQVILGKKWLEKRKATFNKITTILRICDWGMYNRFQVKPISVVQDVLDWRNKIQAFLDKYQLAKQKSEKLVESKPAIVVHDVELQVVKDQSKDEGDDLIARIVEQDSVDVSGVINELFVIQDACDVAALILDQFVILFQTQTSLKLKIQLLPTQNHSFLQQPYYLMAKDYRFVLVMCRLATTSHSPTVS